MAIQTWPAGLNPRPMRDGYGYTPHDPLARTDMDQGPARQRLVYPNSPVTPDLTWPFSEDEYEVFRKWYHEDLGDGASWFWMQVFLPRQQLGLCRFAEPIKPRLNKIEWWVTAKIEIRNAEYIDADAYYLAGTYGPATALGIASRLHTIVHEEAPAELPAA